MKRHSCIAAAIAAAVGLVQVARGDGLELLCNPNATRWKGTNAAMRMSRVVNSMLVHNGRLLLSGGEWNANTGPCPIFSVDMETGAFTNLFSCGTESVWYFRKDSAGRIYIPGVDIKEGTKTIGSLFRMDQDGSWTNLLTIPKGNIASLGWEGFAMHTWDLACWKGKVFTAGYGIAYGDEGSNEAMTNATPGLTSCHKTYEMMVSNRVAKVQVYRRFYSFLPFKDDLYCFPAAMGYTNVNTNMHIEQWRFDSETGLFNCTSNTWDNLCPGDNFKSDRELARHAGNVVFYHATPIKDRVVYIVGVESMKCQPWFLCSGVSNDGVVKSDRIDLGEGFHPMCLFRHGEEVEVLASKWTDAEIEHKVLSSQDGLNFTKVLEFKTHQPMTALAHHGDWYFFASSGLAPRLKSFADEDDSGAIYRMKAK